MKILIAIISTHNSIYTMLNNTIRNTWGNTQEVDIKIIYYYGNTGIELPSLPLLLDDKLYCNHIESLENIGYKTIDAFTYFLNNFEFDYIFRTNESSFIIIEKMIKYLQDKPRFNYASGTVLNQSHIPFTFLAGSGYILSKDIVQLIVDFKHKWNHNYIDDVALGLFLNEHNIPMIDNNAKQDFFNPSDIPDIKENIVFNNKWHFRCKNFSNRNIDVLNMLKLHDIFSK